MTQIKLKFSTYINWAQQNSNRFYVALDYQGQTCEESWENHGVFNVLLFILKRIHLENCQRSYTYSKEHQI